MRAVLRTRALRVGRRKKSAGRGVARRSKKPQGSEPIALRYRSPKFIHLGRLTKSVSPSYQ